jgi:hypothetical protein
MSADKENSQPQSFWKSRKGILLQIISVLLPSMAFNCCGNLPPEVDIHPSHFKIRTSFILNGGIMINTYWGNARKHHVLYLDNHSPSWIKNSRVPFDQSFTKLKKLGFKTSTADGSAVQGDVGICDSLFFEGLLFRNVPFYKMPDSSKNSEKVDGALGIDAMSKAIWKIDFSKSELSCASDIDSFQEVVQAEILPATFAQQSIMVNVDFGNNNVKTMAIDLGYNGDMLLPSVEFKTICSPSNTIVRPGKIITPAGVKVVNNVSEIDTVRINHNWFFAEISTNETVSERLIGLAFFRRFDYVIFDFVDERIYLPKKVW